jgi:hypothetical protein
MTPQGPPSRLEEAVSSVAYAARLYENNPHAQSAAVLERAVLEVKAAAKAALEKNGHS